MNAEYEFSVDAAYNFDSTIIIRVGSSEKRIIQKLIILSNFFSNQGALHVYFTKCANY